jgi:hypothetical protein
MFQDVFALGLISVANEKKGISPPGFAMIAGTSWILANRIEPRRPNGQLGGSRSLNIENF